MRSWRVPVLGIGEWLDTLAAAQLGQEAFAVHVRPLWSPWRAISQLDDVILA